MAKYTQAQCKNFVYRYFLNEGWLPPGTTSKNWSNVTIGQLGIDDPPLPSDPDLQKRRVALELQSYFNLFGGEIPSPLAQLGNSGLTLGELAIWCFENQTG